MTAEEIQEAKRQLAKLNQKKQATVKTAANKPAAPLIRKPTEDEMGKQTRRGRQQVKPTEFAEHPYHADYTETMNSDTLIAIRNSIMSTYPNSHPDSAEAMRYKRITQVLRSRGMQNLD